MLYWQRFLPRKAAVSLGLERVATRLFASLLSSHMSKRSPTSHDNISEPEPKSLKMSDSATNKQVYPATSFLVTRNSPKAKLPTRGSALAAGYDLYR